MHACNQTQNQDALFFLDEKYSKNQLILAAKFLAIKLSAFELAGEDRERRENPVSSRLKIAFYALHKRD
jgi:hypothetical protein